MLPVEAWRAIIGLFNNLRSRRSGDGRVKLLLELRSRLSRRAKEKRPTCEAKNGEDEAEATGGGGEELSVNVEVEERGKGREGQGHERGGEVKQGGKIQEAEQGDVVEEGTRGGGVREGGKGGGGTGQGRTVKEGGRAGEGQRGGREAEQGEGVKGREENGGIGMKWKSTDQVGMLLRMLVALLYLRLFVSGDVELNPGPGLGEYECMVY